MCAASSPSFYAVRQGIRAAAEFYSSGVNEKIESELRSLARKEAAPAAAPAAAP